MFNQCVYWIDQENIFELINLFTNVSISKSELVESVKVQMYSLCRVDIMDANIRQHRLSTFIVAQR